LCCAMICLCRAGLTPAARAAAAYAPGLAGAAYTQAGSAMTMRYFSLGMTHGRYPYHCPSVKWVDFRMVNAPPVLFSRVSMDLRVIFPMISVMESFWATSISYAPLFDDFDDIAASTLLEREGV
jgi:hypothetical protein